MPTEPRTDKVRLTEIFGNALRYWEPRRIAYNGALLLVALGWLGFTWPHFRPSFNLPVAGALSVLAILANLCYSAAYLADITAQFSRARQAWFRWRWSVWVLGTLLALVFEMYFIADEIYPHPFGP